MIRIMAVDDSIIIRKQIERLLEGSNFVVIGSAFDGLDALEQFESLRPTIVTMDLTMPRMDGLQTIEEMLKINPKTKILVVSAMRDKRIAMQAIRLGAYGFLHKPFSRYELTQALSELLEDVLD